jgi:predicted HTH transcriptional regulator
MHPLLQIISGGESDTLDYKKEITSAIKIAKTMVSFANHKGGRLLVGVRDDKTISGIQSAEENYMLDLAANFYCKPAIAIEIVEWNYKGKIVLEVKVPNGNDKPYYAKGDDEKWWVYIRVKDKSLLASKVTVDVLKKSTSNENTLVNFTSKEKALLDYFNANNRITIKEYCKLINISRWRATKTIVNLVLVGVIREHTNEAMAFYTLS